MHEKLDQIPVRYRHLCTRIEQLWGTAQCRSFLIELLGKRREGTSTTGERRGGENSGFPTDVAKTLFAILTEHDAQFPEFDTSDHIVIPFKGHVGSKSRNVGVSSGMNVFSVLRWTFVALLGRCS